MATVDSNVWWGPGSQTVLNEYFAFTVNAQTKYSRVTCTASPEPPHENATIQRLSERWHQLIASGEVD